MRTVRLFIALPVSEEIRKGCEALQNIGKTTGSPVRWIDPEQIHLTLVFLGWTDPSRQAEIEEKIRANSAAVPSFLVKVGGLGAFPRVRSPRVVWAGISEEPPLMALQGKLAAAMGELGFPVEPRPYRPHLTLGRMKEGRVSDLFARWITQGEALQVGECLMEKVTLMESRLGPGGSVYTIQFASPLRDA